MAYSFNDYNFGYRSGRRRGRSKPKSAGTYFADSRPDSSRAFVRDRLFKFDAPQRQALVKHYGYLYGEHAGRYLREVIGQWATGSVRMTAQSERRILECVPKFMTREEQYELLLLSAPTLNGSWSDWGSTSTRSDYSQLDQLRVRYLQSINRIKTSAVTLEWFVKGVFNEQEIEEYVQCLRYVAIEHYRKAFASVLDDLRQIMPIPQIHGCRITYYYEDYLHRFRIGSADKSELAASCLITDNPVPVLITRIGVDNARLIADRILSIDHKMYEGAGVVRIGAHEIQLFMNSLRAAIEGPDYEADFIVKGAGGAMHIEVSKRNLRLLRARLTMIVMLQAAAAAAGIWFLLLDLRDADWAIVALVEFGVVWMIMKLGLKASDYRKELSDYE
jgi:hypothetical protein